MFPGLVLGDRFEIVRRAAVGGMGTVYRALDLETHETVALKLLDHDDVHLTRRFEREAEALRALAHPGIVRYIAHGRGARDRGWLAMEWLDGHDLGARLRAGALPVEAALALAVRVGEALGAAHARGLVHRDVKPSNLFLPDGKLELVKVLDFGVVQVSDAMDSLTRTGHAVGTPRYMAPEQVRGEDDVDARADVFALGCVLHACLTGRHAFSGDDEMAVAARILLAEAARVDDLVEVPAAIADVVAALLAKDRAARPADGSAAAARVAAVAAGLVARGVAPRRASITRREQRVSSVVIAEAPAGPTPPALEAEVRRLGGQLERAAAPMDGTLLVLVDARAAPREQAAQAARCALAVAAALPASRVALASGPAVIAAPNAGLNEPTLSGARPLRLDAHAAVDRATRLLGAAPRAGVWVDGTSRALLEVGFALEVGPEGTRLTGERPAQNAATLLGRATPFLGRERELGDLLACCAAAFDEPAASAVLVVGGQGSGKSRLLGEVAARLEARGARVLRLGRGAERGAGSFSMIGAIVRRAAGIVDGDTLATRRDKLRGLAPLDPWLAELAGTPPGADERTPPAARLESRALADHLSGATVDLLARLARHPLALVIDDLDRVDAASLKLVGDALRELEGGPVVVIAAASPRLSELHPRVFDGRLRLELRLSELGRRAAERLVALALPSADAATVAWIVERAAGNPLTLEELVRAVAAGARPGDDLPTSVLAIAQARFLGFSAEARRVLRAASVFGGVFWAGGVRALVGAELGDRVGELLEDLAAREVIVRATTSRHAGEEEHDFRHTLLREAAYATLPEPDRAVGHRLAATWLAARGADALILAGHLERAGDLPAAARQLAIAAERAQAAGESPLLARELAGRGLALGPTGEVRERLLAALSR